MSKKYSRREFVQTTAGGIAASWGGLRILAGPQAFAQPLESASPAEAPEQKFFVYGSEFFRPPNPPISMREGTAVESLLEAVLSRQRNTICTRHL